VRTFSVSWELSALEVVNIIAFERVHCGSEFPRSRKGVVEQVRGHLKQWGDQAPYEEVDDTDVEAAAFHHVRKLFAEWAVELGEK
jgi:hypothetical protein